MRGSCRGGSGTDPADPHPGGPTRPRSRRPGEQDSARPSTGRSPPPEPEPSAPTSVKRASMRKYVPRSLGHVKSPRRADLWSLRNPSRPLSGPGSEPATDTDFANRLVTLRKDRALTPQVLADRSGVHIAQIRRYEAGNSQPTLHVLRNLALALSVSTDALVFAEADRRPQRRPAPRLRSHRPPGPRRTSQGPHPHRSRPAQTRSQTLGLLTHPFAGSPDPREPEESWRG